MLLFDLTAISLRKSKIGENSGFVVSELIVRSGKEDVYEILQQSLYLPLIQTLKYKEVHGSFSLGQ